MKLRILLAVIIYIAAIASGIWTYVHGICPAATPPVFTLVYIAAWTLLELWVQLAWKKQTVIPDHGNPGRHQRRVAHSNDDNCLRADADAASSANTGRVCGMAADHVHHPGFFVLPMEEHGEAGV